MSHFIINVCVMQSYDIPCHHHMPLCQFHSIIHYWLITCTTLPLTNNKPILLIIHLQYKHLGLSNTRPISCGLTNTDRWFLRGLIWVNDCFPLPFWKLLSLATVLMVTCHLHEAGTNRPGGIFGRVCPWN